MFGKVEGEEIISLFIEEALSPDTRNFRMQPLFVTLSNDTCTNVSSSKTQHMHW